jgi:hypothetical protein
VVDDAKTLPLKAMEAAWAKRREVELGNPGAIERLHAADPLLSDLIDKYIAGSRREIGRTMMQVLKAIKNHGIAKLSCRLGGQQGHQRVRGGNRQDSAAADCR